MATRPSQSCLYKVKDYPDQQILDNWLFHGPLQVPPHTNHSQTDDSHYYSERYRWWNQVLLVFPIPAIMSIKKSLQLSVWPAVFAAVTWPAIQLASTSRIISSTRETPRWRVISTGRRCDHADRTHGRPLQGDLSSHYTGFLYCLLSKPTSTIDSRGLGRGRDN